MGLKIDSCLLLIECFSRRIIHLRTSVIDLIHSERVSTSTSSFFAQRLTRSSHESMIMPKFWCHKYERGSLYFGSSLSKDLSISYYVLYWDHLSLYGHMESTEIVNQSSYKVRDPRKDLESRVAADLLCNWRFWKQHNGYSFKKCIATPCIERTEGFYFGRTSGSKCCLQIVNAFRGEIDIQKRAVPCFCRLINPENFE